MSVKISRALIYALRRLAPRALRDRWTEEWQAEIEHAAEATSRQPRSALRVLRFAAGALADVVSLHRVPRTAVGRGAPLHGIREDFRYASRSLAAAKGFTTTVVASLSIGVAAMAGAYSFINAGMFPRFPGVADQERLVEIYIDRSTFEDAGALRNAIPAFTDVSTTLPLSLAVSDREQTVAARGALVSTNYFDVLGARVAAGRGFLPSDGLAANAAVAVIGHELARRLFGTGAAVGQSITVAGQPVQVIGVAEPGFQGTNRSGPRWAREIWLPAAMAPLVAVPGQDLNERTLPAGQFQLTHVARVSRSSSIDAVLTQASAASASMTRDRVPAPRRVYTRVQPSSDRYDAEMARQIAAVMLLPFLVLLIGCINAANLILARGTARVRDVAVRLALGAGRWRIVRYLLVEGVLLALLAVAVTVPLLMWVLSALDAFVPLGAHVDVGVIAFATAAALASVLLFALAPAVRVSAAGPGAALGSSRAGDTPHRSRLRQALVGVQVALALGLLATGGQLLPAVASLMAVTGAADPSRLLMVPFDLAQLNAAPAEAERFYGALVERVQRVSGVEHVGIARTSAIWTFGHGKGSSPVIVWLPGASAKESKLILGGYAGGDLIQAVGIALRQGRLFAAADRVARPRVAIVNGTAAREFFAGAALGRVIKVGARNREYVEAHDVEIVGVIDPALEPAYVRSSDDPTVPAIYLPAPLEPEPALTLYVRARGDATSMAPAIREAAASVDPRVPVGEITTLAAMQRERFIEERLVAQALALLGVLGLALACGGLYGMIAFLVAMRRREIGVRMALGAEPRRILRLTLKQGMTTALIGSGIGGAIAIAISVVARANMYGVPPMDLIALAGTAAILFAAVLVASFIPARNASRVDPLVVLREE
jgi:putative ABC transport system permease protein